VSDAPDSWYHEKESAWLYGRVAATEPDPVRRAMFHKLGAAAEEQALKWQALNPGRDFRFSPSVRARIVAGIVRRVGPRAARHALAAMKLRGLSVYTASTPPAAPGHLMPTSVSDVGQRHRGVGGGNLRATVFGVNDGLVSNASLVMGVAGASAEPGTVLMTGVAGLLAGALSMAAGEYVSVSSQSDTEKADLARETAELAADPEAEVVELAAIYTARGVEPALSRQVAEQLMARDALGAHARDELGISDVSTARPVQAALTSALTFAAGAAPPLIVALLAPLNGLMIWVSAVALAGLMGLGALGAIAGGADVPRSVLRVAFWGVVALAATAGICRLFGTVV
jgi:VIT1/CCC1 family predicted Fe2+/Mn2+ transporter